MSSWRGAALLLGASAFLAGPWAGVARIGAQAEPPSCTPDPQLVDAATALLLDDEPPTAVGLAEALRAAGSDLPGAQALRAPLGDTAARSRFLRAASERADAPLVCGEAESETMRLLLVTPRAGRLSVATADQAVGAERDPGPGEPVVVRATTPTPSERLEVSLAPRFRDAYLAGRDAEDRMHRWAVDEDVLARGFVMSPDVPRPVVVQLVASGPDGPRPISRVVLGEQDAVQEAPSVDGDDNLATRVATLRATEGVRELRINRLLVAEAAAHAARVCNSGQVRHQGVAGDADDPRVRLLHRGVEARVVGETVARGRSLQAALQALSERPSHRMTLVDRRFTDVGFGTVRGAGGTCVVALFAAWPRFVPHR